MRLHGVMSLLVATTSDSPDGEKPAARNSEWREWKMCHQVSPCPPPVYGPPLLDNSTRSFGQSGLTTNSDQLVVTLCRPPPSNPAIGNDASTGSRDFVDLYVIKVRQQPADELITPSTQGSIMTNIDHSSRDRTPIPRPKPGE